MIKLVLGMGALTLFAAPKASDIRVLRSPQLFMADVARYCLSQPDSKIEQVVIGVRVRDVPSCAAELKQVARAWDRVGKDTPVMSIHVPVERHALVRRALAEEVPGVEYLYETRSCPCLIFKGRRAREWADVGQKMAVER